MERQNLAHLLRACSKSRAFQGGLQIHAALTKAGLDSDLILSNDLVDMYCRCGSLPQATNVFYGMPHKSIVSWTVFMAGHLQMGFFHKSLGHFREMLCSGLRPNEFALSTHLKACGFSNSPRLGMISHALCLKTGFEAHPVVGNSISHVYSTSGLIEEAKKMFKAMPFKNLITWNAMIAGLALNGDFSGAVNLFDEMRRREEAFPDEFTFSSLLKACSGLRAAAAGVQTHAAIIVSGLDRPENQILAGALVDVYWKTGLVSEARKVFDRITEKTPVLFTAMVAGYCHGGLVSLAMEVFTQSRRSGAQTDGFLLSTLMGLFADLAMAIQGRQLHAHSVKLPSGLDVSVANSILDMYFKCGLAEEAAQFFNEMPARNLISWTAAIDGLGKLGRAPEAISLFEEMEREGVEPDEVTFLALLSCCSHAGLVDDCHRFYSRLKREDRVSVKPEHVACMVDVLGRAGRLEEAREVVVEERCSFVGSWQTLLSACKLHKNVGMGREALRELTRLEGEDSASCVTMANILAGAGMWEECLQVREAMVKKRMKKRGGCSWIEVEKRVHSFYGGDDTHPMIEEIKATPLEMETSMKGDATTLVHCNPSAV
ncbi:putative pentatricopeptide repeat-containing protein At3g15130 [Wolffia australiana]